jgi:hypothetical protein
MRRKTVKGDRKMKVRVIEAQISKDNLTESIQNWMREHSGMLFSDERIEIDIEQLPIRIVKEQVEVIRL